MGIGWLNLNFSHIPIKFIIGHRRILIAKRLRGSPKGGLDPLGSSDDGKIEAPPPPTRGRAVSVDVHVFHLTSLEYMMMMVEYRRGS